MPVRDHAVPRTALVLCCLLVLGACTGGNEPDPTQPSVSSTNPTTSTTTATVPTTTTVAPALSLTEYLVATIEGAREAGLTEAAAAVLQSPTEQGARDMLAALDRHIATLRTLNPPDEAADHHEKLLDSQIAWLEWYSDLADAVRDGDQDALVLLQAESQELTFAEIEAGDLQRQLVGSVLAERSDPLARYVFEASVVATQFSGDVQEVLAGMQVLLSASDADLDGLLALLDEEASLFTSARAVWGALEPPGPALTYHTHQGHLMSSAAAGLEGMAAAIRAENSESFQRSFFEVLASVNGALEVSALQSDMLLAALKGEPDNPSSSTAWSWVRVPDQIAISGDLGLPARIMAAAAGGPGFVAVGSTVLASADGITWLRPVAEGAFDVSLIRERKQIEDVVVGGPGLVAVGSVFEEAGSRPAVWTSVDGESWVRVQHNDAVFGGSEDLTIRRVAQADTGLVAFGTEGDVLAGEFGVASWISPDGISWSRVTLDSDVFGEDVVDGLFAGGPGMVAIGTALWTSSDGRAWTRFEHEAVLGGVDAHLNDVVTTASGLVGVGMDRADGEGDAAVWTSTNGATWSRVPHDAAVFGSDGHQLMSEVTAGDFGLLAAGRDASQPLFWVSADGSSWTRIDGPPLPAGESWHVYDLVAGESRVLVYGANSTDFKQEMWVGFPPDNDEQTSLDLRGVWHRDNNGETHEMLICWGPEQTLECSFFGDVDASRAVRGSFFGSLQAGCDVFDSEACDGAIAVMLGEMLLQAPDGTTTGTVSEQIILNVDGSMTLVWVETDGGLSSAPVPFHCPWYRTWSEALASPPDCVFERP